MADNIKYRFIQNVGDFFPSGYFGEDFIDRVQKASGYTNEQISEVCSKYVQFRRRYDEYKNRMVSQVLRPKDSIRYTHEFHTDLLRLLGYGDLGKPYSEPYILDEERMELIPVRHVLHRNDNVQMLVMEMRSLVKVGDEEPAGLFEQQYAEEGDVNKASRFTASQWSDVFTLPEGYKISPTIVNKAISRIFLLPEKRRPSYILMCAGNTLFLFDQEKWNRGSYLSFTLDDLFSQASISAFRKYYALFHWLLCKETLSPQGDTILMDTLVEDSYKNAYEVTKDLKEGVVSAVETLANEALWFWQHLPEDSKVYNPLKTIDYTDDAFEAEVKDDCLVYVYRLLFLFYAESRTELDILPTGDEVYERGYSLEMLRDLEQVRLISEESKRGYFFDSSLKRLFSLLSSGHKENQAKDQQDRSFSVRHIDSPMFDDRKLHHLGQVRFRNEKWQQIICALSLSRKQQGRGRGRISYANLGVNQLGSVYESLLAYRGFYAEEDYIEVHKAGKPEEGTFLVPYSRMDDFCADEILQGEDGRPVILKKGTFVYRLNGRDRQKSASYYTPEILTRSTVKYTLKAIIDEVREGKRKALDLLDLKILEPAMGAAAFQNEVINQLAEAYLQYRQEEKKKEYIERGCLDEEHLEDGTWRIAPDHYRDELQKVKAFIATHNVYGVDLNPTAIELGKLSLWLNVIHKDMETPFFSNRLALGNAVIGAWLKVYSKEEFYGIKGRKKLEQNPWWEKAPHKVKFFKNRVNRTANEVYHFLLPDKAMLAVRNIKEQKQAHPNETAKMNTLIKDWTAPIGEVDFRILLRLSGKIDLLLKEYFEFQRSVENLTQNKMALWGVPGSYQMETFITEKYAEKERLNDARYRHDNAYFRLKMVMDYWCALWFWEYDRTTELPTRREFWSDIEAMLNVTDQELDANTTRALHRVRINKDGQLGNFEEDYMNDLFQQAELDALNIAEGTPLYNADAESEIKQLSKEQILTKTKGEDRSFFDDSERFAIVKEYADRYHFFHPMLEFLEVFWLRDGFDIICGNPPWLKLEFDEIGIISEKYPEVAIRKMSAPNVRKKRDELFLNNPLLKVLYHNEESEIAGTTSFLNAYQNYPLLVGQQTNLYKCIIENGFSLLSNSGYMGLLHPDTVYDDPKAAPLRKEMYHRCSYHFQYLNCLLLFSEIHPETKYGEHIYKRYSDEVNFCSINNLFHPNTIDSCFISDGIGICGGIKNGEKWNLDGHKDRIIIYNQDNLEILKEALSYDDSWDTVPLVNLHTDKFIEILKKFSNFNSKVWHYPHIMTRCFDETAAVNNGSIKRVDNCYPNLSDYEMIYSGPHFYINNPYYKTPLEMCRLRSDYDSIDIIKINSDYLQRTNYIPTLGKEELQDLCPRFKKYHDKPWVDYYKLGFRLMLNQPGERTLIGSILPHKSLHIHTLLSVVFENKVLLAEFAGLQSSLVVDFYIKAIGKAALATSTIDSFPLGIDAIYRSAIIVRTLMLNCLTRHYTELWNEMWRDDFRNQTWSINDDRLHPFNTLQKDWSWATPLRNYFERRQALVEIDVIAAMALGLSLQDLEMIYTIQFPVLQQNENDTWYDAEGKIVFTCSKGLTGVGLDRPAWNAMRGTPITDADGTVIAYEGAEPQYTHTIDPAKSELYGGQQQTFIAPYNRCDRIADYRTAWAHFEKVFNLE